LSSLKKAASISARNNDAEIDTVQPAEITSAAQNDVPGCRHCGQIRRRRRDYRQSRRSNFHVDELR
jgi:hypothetical protein